MAQILPIRFQEHLQVCLQAEYAGKHPLYAFVLFPPRAAFVWQLASRANR